MAKSKNTNMTSDNEIPNVAPAASLEAAVVNAPATVDLDAMRSQIEAEVRAKIAEEQRTDPGYVRPGVRTITQEAIAQTKVVTGDRPLDATQAPPKNTIVMDNGTIRQDY